MNNKKFSKLVSILKEKGFKTVVKSEEKIEYSLWDGPKRGNYGFPKITKDLKSGKQTFRVLIPDKSDWLKSHWEIRTISSKEKEENRLKETGYNKIRDVTLHVVEFVKSSSAIRLHEVKNLGFFISTTGEINRALIYRVLGIKRFSGNYDDFIFGQPWKVWKELSINPRKIDELRKKYSKRGISIKRIKNKTFLIVGKAPDGVIVRFYFKY